MPIEPIRVELSAFCKKFSSVLTPFSDALDQAVDAFRKVPEKDGMQPVIASLQDNRHRLKILRDKAAQEHTYLVIFGPLKSGKSTLMNALSGAYVSEVSSLPAYPCLVYLHESDATRFSTTAFNGDERQFSSADALKTSMEEAHQKLAERIRNADEAGGELNPQEDFSEAIRRIDFEMPAPYLKESGTILVDTPGLYTKMKYHYSQLTRDFRDTAACAVFVVKTDNLFFEQVFDEFADLLDVFSKIFLVVNIDSSKKDLGPDGNLQPSLESEDPHKIVEAFENLTVNAPIRSAMETGQLQVYLVDLLQAAAHSLTTHETETQSGVQEELPVEAKDDAGAGEAGAVEETDKADSEPGEAAAEPVVADGDTAQSGFQAFRKDLIEFLNSSDYIVAFMADSLRQAGSIIDEVNEQAVSDKVVAFQDGIELLRSKAERADRQAGEVRELRGKDWNDGLAYLQERLNAGLKEAVEGPLPALKSELHEVIDAWIVSDESLRTLLEERIQPKLKAVLSDLRSKPVEVMDHHCSTPQGGLKLDPEVIGKMQRLGIAFDDIYPRFKPQVTSRFDGEAELPDPSVVQEALPVRRNIVDWLLFRSTTGVRKRLLGDAVPSDIELPAGVKAKRLGVSGVDYLREAVDTYVDQALGASVNKAFDELLQEYQVFLQQEAQERLETKTAHLEKEKAQALKNAEGRQEVMHSLNQLISSSDALRGEMADLQEAYLAGKSSLVPAGDPDLQAAEDAEAGAESFSSDSAADPQAAIDSGDDDDADWLGPDIKEPS
ncbi:MAG: dynamin family protein [Opitutales bacterium]